MIQLNGELDSFRDLLSFSQKWLSRIDGMSPAVMQEMLNFREKWITRVSNRKEDWISLARQAGEEYAGKFIKSMSGALTELQSIDAQIYKRLEERKQDYLRLISDLTTSGNSKTGSWKNHAPVELLKRSLTVYSKQQGAIAENVANADNPNFRRLDTDFSEILQGVQESRLATTSARHLPGSTTSTIHLQDNEEERVDINTEMADLAVNQIHFEFSAQALRRMYSGILSSISGRSS